MIDACFLKQQYEFVQKVTEDMLAEAEIKNWQRIYELDQLRGKVLENLSGEDVKKALSQLDLATADRIRQCVQTVLAANIRLSELAELEKQDAQTGLHSTSVSARLNRTYSSSF